MKNMFSEICCKNVLQYMVLFDNYFLFDNNNNFLYIVNTNEFTIYFTIISRCTYLT